MRVGKLDKACAKYLAVHAEPDRGWVEQVAASCAAVGIDEFAHVVVIPAYNEGEGVDRSVDAIETARAQAPVLTVVCLNQRASSPPEVTTTNAATHERLRSQFRVVGEYASATVHQTASGALVVVTATLPDDQGVGLARKIGVDLALRLWTTGSVKAPWIHCTDADAVVPADYFEQAVGLEGAALVYPFRHVSEPSLREAIAVYEIWLRYHVLGLRYAESPYAFHSIGSTVAVAPGAYAQVRGFPRKQAAEDFYLLNKLSKCGPIVATRGAPITLEGRVSDRVPFGTGRAMGTASTAGVDRMPQFAPPQAYAHLRQLTRECERALAGDGVTALPDHLATAADSIGLTRGIAQAHGGSADLGTRRRRFHEWLDGIRILKLLHYWRDAQPSVGALEALRAAPFITLDIDDPDVDQRAIAALAPKPADPNQG